MPRSLVQGWRRFARVMFEVSRLGDSRRERDGWRRAASGAEREEVRLDAEGSGRKSV